MSGTGYSSSGGVKAKIDLFENLLKRKAPAIENRNKRRKSSDLLSQIDANVCNSFLIKRQLIAQKLFSTGTTTANPYNRELENRKKKQELLKRQSIDRNKCQELNCSQSIISFDATLSEAFKDIQLKTELNSNLFREQSLKDQNNRKPSKQMVVFKANVLEKQNGFDFEKRDKKINEDIEKLEREVENQYRIAGQTSKALRIGLQSNGFRGSAQQVEAEKFLLLSGQKRLAFLSEISKLKIKLNDKSSQTANGNKYFLSLHNFRLQMKDQFLLSQTNGLTDVHNFILLLHNGPNVYQTIVLNTETDLINGGLEYEFRINLADLSPDFQIIAYIYDLITPKRQMPHEIKYKCNKKRTPKKNKSSVNWTTIQSTGAQIPILRTGFQFVGLANINGSNHQKTSFNLENFQ